MPYELPSNSRSPHDGPTTIAESKAIFSAISARDPEELVKAYRFKSLNSAIALAQEARIESHGEPYDDFYVDLVKEGYEDTRRGTDVLDMRGKTLHERIETVHDPRTILALGQLAMRSEESMDGVLANNSSHGDRLKAVTDSDGREYLRMIQNDNPHEKPGERTGCPFAVIGKNSMPSKPYVNFARWSSELAIRLYQLEYEVRQERFGR